MSYEQKNNQGSLFRNTRKESEKHPDYTGSITLSGTQHQLAAWLKTAKSGQKYMSVSIGKQIIKGAGPAVNQPNMNEDVMEDDRPF